LFVLTSAQLSGESAMRRAYAQLAAESTGLI
jgi:hypothetical protein